MAQITDIENFIAVSHKGKSKPHLEWLVANQLTVDWKYQRKISPSKVQDIVDNFDADSLRTLDVSHRGNGVHVVLDGQHRLEAIHRLGWSDQRVPCLVHEGLTLEDEALIFNRSNTAKPLHPVDRFRSRVVGKDPQALMVKQAVEDAGYILTLGSHNSNQAMNGLVCVTILEEICAVNGPAFLVLVLGTINTAWDYEPTSRTRDIIEGVWRFLRWYAEEPNFNRDVFVAKLKTVAPVKLLRDAISLREALGNITGSAGRAAGRNSIAISQLLVKLYNTGMRSNKQIPDWHEKERAVRFNVRSEAGKIGGPKGAEAVNAARRARAMESGREMGMSPRSGKK